MLVSRGFLWINDCNNVTWNRSDHSVSLLIIVSVWPNIVSVWPKEEIHSEACLSWHWEDKVRWKTRFIRQRLTGRSGIGRLVHRKSVQNTMLKNRAWGNKQSCRECAQGWKVYYCWGFKSNVTLPSVFKYLLFWFLVVLFWVKFRNNSCHVWDIPVLHRSSILHPELCADRSSPWLFLPAPFRPR